MVDLVTVDMPMAHSKIERRRVSDDLVSSAYSTRGAGTHSASAERPGKISDTLRADFTTAGYPLRTLSIATPGLIEVYPHPALIELLNLEMRLKYKAAKVSKYWTDLSPSDRRAELLKNWRLAVAGLDLQIAGVADAFPMKDTQLRGWALKAEEDKLDAVICAWVGICALEGRARPYGDADSAIWIPDKVLAR